jgi:hypothetical protein
LLDLAAAVLKLLPALNSKPAAKSLVRQLEAGELIAILPASANTARQRSQQST